MGLESQAGAAEAHELSRELWAGVAFLRAYKWLILGVAVALALGIGLWTVRQPKVYQATCTIEYDPNPPRPLGRSVQELAEPVNWWATRELFETQNKILASRTIAELAVRKLGLHKNPDFVGVPPESRRGWNGTSPAAAAQTLQGKLSVEPIRDTRIVNIRVEDTSPKRAMLLANTLADVFIQKNMEDRLGSTSRALDWLSTQLDTLKDRLNKAEQSLHTFKEDHNVLSVSLEDRQNIVANEIQRYSEELAQAGIKRIGLQARLKELEAANAENPMEVNATALTGDPAIAALRRDYRELKAEIEAKSTRYGSEHPEIRALRKQMDTVLAQTRNAIDGLIANAKRDVTEAKSVEAGLKQALDRANEAGLELNLREIEYQRLNRERENTEKLYGVVLERTAETDLTRALRVSFVRIIDRALEPRTPVRPRLWINVLLATLAGLILGAGLAVVISRLDRTLRSVEDAEGLGLTMLGIVPSIEKGLGPTSKEGRRARGRDQPATITNRDLAAHYHPMSSIAESCRTLRTNLTFMTAERARQAFVVTSPRPQEGKTTVAVSLAIVLAQGGKRTLLVDTDLRRPRMHRTFDTSNERGMTSIIANECSMEQAIQPTLVEGLSVLPAGPIPPNPAELLHTPAFRAFLAQARERYDYIIFDSPPLGAVTDAAVIAPQVDGALVVTRAGHTTRDSLKSTLRQLSDVQAEIVGGVLNDVDLSSHRHGYSHYYYYHYYRDASQEDGDRERQPSAAE